MDEAGAKKPGAGCRDRTFDWCRIVHAKPGHAVALRSRDGAAYHASPLCRQGRSVP